ncbi:MAG: cysteine desulfurase family protein [Verrucomicrobiota bacterium]|nr:cysteine desulfurase family protein [Verrucomicrobiota bacterium]
MKRVYLDHQAGTVVLPEVLEFMEPFFRTEIGVPSSLHSYGLRNREAVELARQHCATLVGAEASEEIIFTSSGTESVNLAIKGFALANRHRGRHFISSYIEHPSLVESLHFLEREGFEVTWIGADNSGLLKLDELKSSVRKETLLVCTHLSNFEVGTIQDVKEIAGICRNTDTALFLDANFAAGWMAIEVEDTGIDLLSFSPHRFYGPKGVGVLYKRRNVRLQPLIHGGSQEQGKRAGTMNVPAIVGAGKAAEIALTQMADRSRHLYNLQKLLLERISEIPHLKLNGPEPGPLRNPWNINLSAAFTEGEGVALFMDMRGVALASSSACFVDQLKISPVLTAMGVAPDTAKGTIIFTLGQENTVSEIEYAADQLKLAVDRLRSMSPEWAVLQNST